MSLRVLFATSELVPLIKTGGLADVSAALPDALARRGHRVTVMLPGYGALLDQRGPTREIGRFSLMGESVSIRAGRLGRLDVWYVDAPGRFHRDGGAYADAAGRDFGDNAERFAIFCRAIVATLAASARSAPFDVVHLNDWQTGLAAPLARQLPNPPRVVFGIHNLAYQGRFDRQVFERLELPGQWWSPDAVEFHGDLSFLKAGIGFADAITTVSPSYAHEIKTPQHGEGLDGLLRHRASVLFGIVNGIDTCIWNPATDVHLAHRFTRDDLPARARNKPALQHELGLAVDPGAPLLGMITRLAYQKGIDLVIEALPRILELGAQLVVLGRGDHHHEAALAAAAAQFPDRIAFLARLDEGLAHRIEGGADVFVMPSRYEPCGLNQMYSQRYGCIPVVRRTGGLADTVTPSSGFAFDDPSPQALGECLADAIAVFRDRDAWHTLMRNGMARDFSWQQSANAYEAVYHGGIPHA